MSDTSNVRIGSMVRVLDRDGEEEEYTIVGSEEADVASGRISSDSPLAMALLGHHEGDQVKVRAPGGLRGVTIVRVGVPTLV